METTGTASRNREVPRNSSSADGVRAQLLCSRGAGDNFRGALAMPSLMLPHIFSAPTVAFELRPASSIASRLLACSAESKERSRIVKGVR